MASASSTWYVENFQTFRHGLPYGGCLYGPEFKVGNSGFQVHLRPNFDGGLHGGSIYLRLHTENDLASANALTIRATFKIPEFGYETVFMETNSLARWLGGLGPDDCLELSAAAQAFAGNAISVDVHVEVLEVRGRSSTILRWPLGNFAEYRARAFTHPCESLSRVVEICGLDQEVADADILALRLYLNPNADATGNLFLSFKIADMSPLIDSLGLQYEITFEEVNFSEAPELIQGGKTAFKEGIVGQCTNCPFLRRHSGSLTLRIKISVCSSAAAPPKSPQPLRDSVSTEYRYLLISSTGGDASDACELMDGSAFSANACAWNIHKLHGFLVEGGVPAHKITVAAYDGLIAQPHPRTLLDNFFCHPGFLSTKAVVYFSGTASVEDGSWFFRWLPEGHAYAADVTIRPDEFFEWHARSVARESPLELIVESMGAGAWCLAAKNAQLNGRVLAACAPGCAARVESEGSPFTDWVLGTSSQGWESYFRESSQTPWQYTGMGIAGAMPMAQPKKEASMPKHDVARTETPSTRAPTPLMRSPPRAPPSPTPSAPSPPPSVSLPAVTERRVWLGGLPKSPRNRDLNKELQEHLKQAGSCKFVDVSKGQGKAIFGSAEEATAAIAMLNGSVFKGSVLQVDVWETTARA